MIDLPEDSPSHVRVARSPQLGQRFAQNHPRLFPGAAGGGGRFAQPAPAAAPAPIPGVAQSQASAMARSFQLRGNFNIYEWF